MKKLLRNTGIKMELATMQIGNKLKNKLKEESGVSLSKENLIWIIIVLIVGGIAIGLVEKFFPEIFEMIFGKIKDFFGKITI